jgi:predicted enzyme related to lactoylglutathione lyase
MGGANGERSTAILKGISGATTWSEDLNNLLPFYRDTLGLKPTMETPDFVVFGDEQKAAVFGLGTHSEVKGKNNDPARHMVGFMTDDIEAEVAGLKSKGVEFVSDPENFDQVRVATLKDPEGNYVQILQFA